MLLATIDQQTSDPKASKSMLMIRMMLVMRMMVVVMMMLIIIIKIIITIMKVIIRLEMELLFPLIKFKSKFLKQHEAQKKSIYHSLCCLSGCVNLKANQSHMWVTLGRSEKAPERRDVMLLLPKWLVGCELPDS